MCSLYSARQKILVRYNVYVRTALAETRPCRRRPRPRPYLPSTCIHLFIFITILPREKYRYDVMY